MLFSKSQCSFSIISATSILLWSVGVNLYFLISDFNLWIPLLIPSVFGISSCLQYSSRISFVSSSNLTWIGLILGSQFLVFLFLDSYLHLTFCSPIIKIIYVARKVNTKMFLCTRKLLLQIIDLQKEVCSGIIYIHSLCGCLIKQSFDFCRCGRLFYFLSNKLIPRLIASVLLTFSLSQ